MFGKKGNKFKHDASTLAKACGVSQKKIKRKQDQLNDYIVNSQLKSKEELQRSRVIEKLEQLFTKRELAYITQQYSEMIQKGGLATTTATKDAYDDPSVM